MEESRCSAAALFLFGKNEYFLKFQNFRILEF